MLRCTVEQGIVTSLKEAQATMRIRDCNPKAGERALARCKLETREPGTYELRGLDSYPHGGMGGIIALRVAQDGKRLLDHDMAAEAFTGELNVLIEVANPAEPPEVEIEVVALSTTSGPAWGCATPVRFQIAEYAGP